MRTDCPSDRACGRTLSPTPQDIEALGRVLERVRRGEPVDARLIQEVALASFEAGIAAAKRNGDVAPSTSSGGDRDGTNASREAESLPPALTPRRLEVLRLVARGLTNDEIGAILGISRLTVKSHLSALFATLEVTNRTEAAFAFQRFEALLESRSD